MKTEFECFTENWHVQEFFSISRNIKDSTVYYYVCWESSSVCLELRFYFNDDSGNLLRISHNRTKHKSLFYRKIVE